MNKKSEPTMDANNWNWWCCGLRRGPGELRCPLCCSLQPGKSIPDNAILLRK